MFTGIVQNLGRVISYTNRELEISTPLDLSDCKLGSSICCNGVCLTATEINFINNSYKFKTNVGEETMIRTTFSDNLKKSIRWRKKKLVLKYSQTTKTDFNGLLELLLFY